MFAGFSVSTEQHGTEPPASGWRRRVGAPVPGALSGGRWFWTYLGLLQALTAHGGTVGLRLVFRDEAQRVLGVANGMSGPTGSDRWVSSATGEAPAGTTTVLPSPVGRRCTSTTCCCPPGHEPRRRHQAATINAATFGVMSKAPDRLRRAHRQRATRRPPDRRRRRAHHQPRPAGCHRSLERHDREADGRVIRLAATTTTTWPRAVALRVCPAPAC